MKTETSHIGQLMSSLPIAKHFDGEFSKPKPKAGEIGIYHILRIALLGTIGYFSWIYVLPQVFMWLGKLAAITVTGIALVFLVLAAPAIFKFLKVVARKLHKAAIRQDPFMELEKQQTLIEKNRDAARSAHAKIQQLEQEMRVEADVNEKNANDYQKKIISLHAKAEKIKNEIIEMQNKYGSEAKSMDEYVQLNSDLMKVGSESTRVSARLTQAQSFVSKYGTRAAVMKKVSHKLTLVETAMDNKVEDFKATVEILKKDYEFASKSRAATDAAKGAMLFNSPWELNYALEVVSSTIAEDIAMTSSNFKDIETLTMNFNMDSDEMFNNLNALAEDIKLGKNITPSAKDYNAVDYKPSYKDNLNSGGFGKLF